MGAFFLCPRFTYHVQLTVTQSLEKEGDVLDH